MLFESFLKLNADKKNGEDNYARIAARKALHNMEVKALRRDDNK